MCGIAGIVRFDPTEIVPEARLVRMRDALRHRGPDDQGVWMAAAVRVALNESVLPDLLAMRFIAGEETLFRGIRKLMPGRTLSWSPGDAPQLRRYWRLPMAIDHTPLRLDDRARELRQRLEAA